MTKPWKVCYTCAEAVNLTESFVFLSQLMLLLCWDHVQMNYLSNSTNLSIAIDLDEISKENIVLAEIINILN